MTDREQLELIEAAKNASAVLSHAYHTQIRGSLAEDAHSAYQRLDCAIDVIEKTDTRQVAPAPDVMALLGAREVTLDEVCDTDWSLGAILSRGG